MQPSEIRLQDYISVVYRKKWAVLISFVLVLGISMYYAVSKPPVYTSSATIKIDLQTVNLRSDGGAVVQNITQPVEYYDRIFRTGIFQKEVLDTLSSDVHVRLIARDEQVDLGTLIGGSLSLSDAGQGFFRIVVTASHPELTYRLADVTSRLFQKRCREIERENLQDADTYLDEQLNLLRTKLEQSEIDLQRFLRENGLVEIGSKVKGNRDLNQLQTEIEKIQLSQELTNAKLRAYRRKRDELMGADQLAAAEKDLDEIRANVATIDSLSVIRATLLKSRETKDPEVVRLDQQIAQKRHRNLEIETRLMDAKPKSDTTNLLPILQAKIVDGENGLFEMSTDAEYYQQKMREFGQAHPDMLDQELELNRLTRAKELVESAYNMLIQRREEQNFAKAMQTGGVKMIDPARLPDAPSPSNAPKQILFGAVLGLSLGLGAAFLLEYMDTSLKSAEDVTRFLALPLMGEIPRIKPPSESRSRGLFSLNGRAEREVGYNSRLISNFSPKEPIPEAYRALRTNLQFAFLDEPLRGFVISSPGASEGKSLTTANLGIGFAQSGKKTLIVDTDLRRPVMHKIFDVPREPGITDVLLGQVGLLQAIQPTTIDGLFVLTAGQSSPNPGELINSQRMLETLERLKQEMEIVLLDSPPIIAAIDASVLGTKTQGLLLVFHMDETKREAARYSLEQLRKAGVHIIGALLNNIDVDKRYGYSYGYRYYYRYRYYYYAEDGQRKHRKKEKEQPDA